MSWLRMIPLWEGMESCLPGACISFSIGSCSDMAEGVAQAVPTPLHTPGVPQDRFSEAIRPLVVTIAWLF